MRVRDQRITSENEQENSKINLIVKSNITGMYYELNKDTCKNTGLNRNTTTCVNSHGFLGEETTIEKPENTTRIAVLGDSITASIGDGENKFTNQLPSFFRLVV